MTTSTHTVISGVTHPVTSVAQVEPAELAQFVGDTEFVVDMAGVAYRVCGCGCQLDELVRFHEKDETAGGKDVRVWQVTRGDSGFQAEPVAAY